MSQAAEPRPVASDELAAAEQVLAAQLALIGRWQSWPEGRELTPDELIAIAEDANRPLDATTEPGGIRAPEGA